MLEFEVGGVAYQARKMDAIQQAFVLKRLAPVIGAVVKAITGLPPPPPDDAPAEGRVAFQNAVLDWVAGDGAEILAGLPDADLDFVLKACLKATTRQNPRGGGWAILVNSSGGLMFEDLELPDMMQIVWRVLEYNFKRFFPERLTSAAALGDPSGSTL